MRKKIIEIIKKTVVCEPDCWDCVPEYDCVLQNPEEVADAVIKVIFGIDMMKAMYGEIDMDEVAKRFNKKNKDKKMVKIIK